MLRYFLFVQFFFIACASSRIPFSEKDFQPLYQLIGTWKMETPRGSVFEEWQRNYPGSMTGCSYRISNGDTTIMETIGLFLEGKKIIYSPNVSTQNNGESVAFILISKTGNKYVFENKKHDFPQRIIYDLKDDNNLHARIEGTLNGKEEGRDFIYVREM